MHALPGFAQQVLESLLSLFTFCTRYYYYFNPFQISANEFCFILAACPVKVLRNTSKCYNFGPEMQLKTFNISMLQSKAYHGIVTSKMVAQPFCLPNDIFGIFYFKIFCFSLFIFFLVRIKGCI